MDRRTYIGGSDAGALLGHNDYQSVRKTWRKKVGLETDDADNHHIRRGNTMEPIIELYCRDEMDGNINNPEMFKRYGTLESQQEYAEWVDVRTKEAYPKPLVVDATNIFSRPQVAVRHPKYPYCGGHPDGLSPKGVWEFKAPAMRNFKRIEQMGAKRQWMIQVQYYMWITGLPKGFICVWDYDEWRPLVIRLKPNEYLHRQFEEIMPAFWFHVETRTEPTSLPAIDMEKVFSNDLLDVFLYDYYMATQTYYDAETERKHKKALIVSLLEGAPKAETDNFYVSAPTQKSYGTEYVRLTVRPKETEQANEWMREHELERAVETVEELDPEAGEPAPEKEANS